MIREGLEGLVLKDVKVRWSRPLLSSTLAGTWLWQFEVLDGVPSQDSCLKSGLVLVSGRALRQMPAVV